MLARQPSLILILMIAVFVGCTPQPTETTTASTFQASTTTISEIQELLEEARLLSEWEDSTARLLAIEQWRDNLTSAATAYSLSLLESGEVVAGDCRMGGTGYVLDCGFADSLNDELVRADLRRICPTFLADFGCRSFDEIAEPIYQAWLDERS